jgi:SAM-dependent methyltransferase
MNGNKIKLFIKNYDDFIKKQIVGNLVLVEHWHLCSIQRRIRMDNTNTNRPPNFFDSVYKEGFAPWDIGKPQPALTALFDKYPLIDPVLDVGCGAGDLALAIANRGYSVLGIDLAEKAIEKCKSKAALAQPEVRNLTEFRLGDALNISQLNKQFGSIVDSGFYHIFGQAERDRFIEEISKSLNTGGRYYLLGFAIDSPMPNAPKQVTRKELEEKFSRTKGWNILEISSAEFITASSRGNVSATAACIEKGPSQLSGISG